MFAVAAEGGLFLYQTKTFPILKDKPEASILLSDSITLRLILGFISMLIFVGIGLLSGKPDNVKLFFAFLGATLLFNNILGAFSAVLYGYEKFGLFGFISSGVQISSTLLGIGAVYWGFGLSGIGAAQLASVLVATVLTSYIVSNKVCRPNWSLSLNRTFNLFKSAVSLGVISIFTIIYFRINIAILSFIKGDEAVGYYNAAFQIIGGFMVISATFASVLLPRMSKLLTDDLEKLYSLYAKAFKYMFFIGSGIAVGTVMVARPLMEFLFSAKYSASADILIVLIWVTMFMFTNTLQGSLLVARNANRALLTMTIIAAGLNLILCFILIPLFGYFGAAFAVLSSELFMWVFSYTYNLRFLPIKKLYSIIIPAFFSSLVMAAILKIAEFQSVILSILSGMLVYIISLFIFHGLKREDIEALKNIFSFSKRIN